MQTILKLQSALWDYRTTFKTSIQSTPFWMAFGLDAVMPIELQVPSLRVQVKERLPESQSEQYRLDEQLLELGEHQVANMAELEQRQRQRKTFMDRHRKGTGKSFTLGKLVLVFQTRLGAMPGKLRFRWTGPFWIIDEFNGTFQLGTLANDIVQSWVNGFRLKPYHGTVPPNPFAKSRHDTDQPTTDNTGDATCQNR